MGEKAPRQSDGNDEQDGNVDGQAEHPAQAIAKNLIQGIRERDAGRPQVAPPEPAPKQRKWFGRSSVIASVGIAGVAMMAPPRSEAVANELLERAYVTREVPATEAYSEHVDEIAEPDNIPSIPINTLGVAVDYEITS